MKNQCIRTLNKGKLLKILFLVFFIQPQRVRFMIDILLICMPPTYALIRHSQ